MSSESEKSSKYRHTLRLPSTSFSLKRQAHQEQENIRNWLNQDLYQRRIKAREGAEEFLLLGGPPYANGKLHLGHYLNVTLKDLVASTQFMAGKQVIFTLGWDCHGLPIEWKVEETLAQEKNIPQKEVKRVMDPAAFRDRCREFASHWIHIQKEGLKSMGIVADLDNPYITMEASYTTSVALALLKLAQEGYIYRGLRPVLWSVTEQTALAEAEVEYADVTSTALYVAFPVQGFSAKAVIWTTTPWTLPANRAIAYHPDIDYVELRIESVDCDSFVEPGQIFWIAQERTESFVKSAKIVGYDVLRTFEGRELQGLRARHPLYDQGYAFDVPFVPGEHVTAESGTGLVHTAPSHGEEDFSVALREGLEIPELILGDGTYVSDLPLFGGQSITHVTPQMIETLCSVGNLVAQHTIRHRCGHSWRSKKPLIHRTTAQWFMALDHGAPSLRERALRYIEEVRWLPGPSKNRLQAMISGRPDWCLSRQRFWGIPLPLILHKPSGKAVVDQAVCVRIAQLIQDKGIESWWTCTTEDFGDVLQGNLQDFEKVTDVVDVWVDSGLVHHIVTPQRARNGSVVADMYVEGSDQHRGWFNTSLLLCAALHHQAPYKQVFTHGFVLDEQGRKMSKSLGNVLGPEQLAEKYGHDVMRLWVALSDVHDDIRVGPTILQHAEDVYRRLRNTFRFLLSVLTHEKDIKPIRENELQDWPLLERGILHHLALLQERIDDTVSTHAWANTIKVLHHFCTTYLSSLYFDIRKDTLYCDTEQAVRRQRTCGVLQAVLDLLIRWLAPVTPLLCQEVWHHGGRGLSSNNSVHLESFVRVPAWWRDEKVGVVFAQAQGLRRVITGALEKARIEGRLGSSLQGHPVIFWGRTEPLSLTLEELQEWCLTSGITLKQGDALAEDNIFQLEDFPQVGVSIELAKGDKCARCWQISPEVVPEAEALCGRCQEVIQGV